MPLLHLSLILCVFRQVAARCTILAGKCSAPSGFGDRIGVILNVAALGKVRACRVVTVWSEFPPKVAWSRERPPELYNWSTMSRYFSLSTNIEVLSKADYDDVVAEVLKTPSSVDEWYQREEDETALVCYGPWHTHDDSYFTNVMYGMNQVHETAFARWVQEGVLRDEHFEAYMAAYHSVGKHLQPSRLIQKSRTAGRTSRYLALHIRKHRNPNVSSFVEQGSDSEGLKLLNYNHEMLLSDALVFLHGLLQNAMPIMVLADTPTETHKWSTYLTSLGASVVDGPLHRPVARYSSANDLADFFAIAGSAGVLVATDQRGGWSSFSAVAAMAKKLPLLFVHNGAYFQDEERVDRYVAQLNRRPRDFFLYGHRRYRNKHELLSFLERAFNVPAGAFG
eukprot:TRINITY_DN49050_c0_g1_i1.p1 TRINITY_DN49050_c0_g1~~TRINITY_DN49050_c0_g1_i1.p1  ORF type:complete len:394 (+),score=22.52 TRINITY_DN49050_c0_g1_i1:168-1349(+)